MTYLMQVALPYFTGQADDVVVNTFHLDWTGGGSPSGSDYLAARSSLIDFYDVVLGGNDASGALYLAP